MQEIILGKLGEVALKGLNRHTFEEKLMTNLRRRLQYTGEFLITSRQSTIYIEPKNENCDIDAAYEAAKQVFGLAAVSRAMPCEKSKEAILETAKTYLRDEIMGVRSFKVESKRSDKNFPMTSIQISQWVGGELNEAFPHLQVDVHKPELTIHVEVRENSASVHRTAAQGAGGLPIGMGGIAVSLLSGGIDSPVSSWMIAKRGVSLEMVHFFSPPYTSPQARAKVLKLAQELTGWCGRLRVHIVPFTEIQEDIRRAVPEEYFTLIMRRFIMEIAQRLAKGDGCGALITGENLGQVASQTMEAMTVTGAVVDIPIFMPLVGMDKEEIVTIARKIGTMETSILPYEDCCTVFTPKHPKTKPTIGQLLHAESKLDRQAMIDKAVETVERIKVTYHDEPRI